MSSRRRVGAFLSLAIGMACAVESFAVTSASAATLGGISTRILTSVAVNATSGAPTVTVWENFDAINATNIVGTKTDGGAKTWSAPRCSWTVTSNRAVSTRADCPLLVDSGNTSSIAEVALARNGSTAWDAGIVLRSNATATTLLAVEYTSASNGSVELWKYNGSWVSLGRTTGLYPSGVATAPASVTLRVEALAPVAPATTTTVRARLDGTQRLSFTLSAADHAIFAAATQSFVGPYTYFDATTTFDNFHLDIP